MPSAARPIVFTYPKERHKRGPDPGPLPHYSDYKPHLRMEFRGTCIYCRMRDSPARERLFAVEHYLPKSRYPERETDWSNLFYACSTCNGHKSNFVREPGSPKYFPNPVDDSMFEHLRYVGTQVTARSPTGHFALERLDLNEPGTVEWRNTYSFILRAALDEVDNWLDVAAEAQAAVDRTTNDDDRTRAVLDCDAAVAALAEAEAALRHIAGPFDSDVP